MKRSLIFICLLILTLGANAQNIPLFSGQYVPFHAFITNHKPVDNTPGTHNNNQLKDYLGTFEVAALHYVNVGQGWNIHDSSTLIYMDSLPFAIADTTLAYVSFNQSWIYDSVSSITSYFSPSQPVSDQDSFPASKTGQVYNSGSNSWGNAYNYNYTYDADQRLSAVIYQTWNGGWTNVSQTTYAYDTYGRLDTLSVYSYNSGWQNDTQYVYSYNAQGRDSIVYVNIGSGNTWANGFEYVYQYTPISNLFTGIDISVWSGSSWAAYGIYSYTRNNNQASYLLQLYQGGQYINKYEEVFTYDYRNDLLSFTNDSINGSTITPLVQYQYSYDINNDLTWEQDSYWNDTSYYYTNQYYFYYQWLPVVGAINNVADVMQARVYPNPSHGPCNIQLTAYTNTPLIISVADAAGRQVSQSYFRLQAGNNILPVQLNNLAAGSYIINMRQPGIKQSTSINWIKQ